MTVGQFNIIHNAYFLKRSDLRYTEIVNKSYGNLKRKVAISPNEILKSHILQIVFQRNRKRKVNEKLIVGFNSTVDFNSFLSNIKAETR